MLAILFSVLFLLQVREHFKFRQEVIYNQGTFAKQAISFMEKSVQKVNYYSLFYLAGEDVSLRSRFAGVLRVGYLPAGASLAVYYKMPYDKIEVVGTESCNDVKNVLEKWKGKKINQYYFIATSKGIKQEDAVKIQEKCFW